MKKKFSSFLMFIMVLSLGGCTSSNVNYTEKKVSVYRDSLTSDETVGLRMVGDIPYIKIDDYYNGLIFTGAEKYPQQASLMKVTRSGSVYETAAYDGTKGIFDAEKDTFECENLERYTNQPYYALLLASERDPSAPFIRISSVDYFGEVTPVKVDFKKYGIDLIGDGNELWVPLATLQSLFCSPYAYNVFYNGKAIYISDGLEQLQSVNAKDMDEDYYAFGDTVRSEEKISFDYNNLCFFVDTCFGCPENSRLSANIAEDGLDKTLDQTIDGMELPGVKKMLLSQDMKEYAGGLFLLFMALDDGGHTGFSDYNWVQEEDISKWTDAMTKLGIMFTDRTMYGFSSSKEIAAVFEKAKQDGFDRLEVLAYDNGSEQGTYVEKGDTAMYVFEHFYCNRSAWTDYEDGKSSTMPEDSMGTFMRALEMAKANPAIKKFVVNLSMNGGGESGIATTISKIMCGQAFRHQYNDYTGQDEILHYDVDLNFDGKFDEKDNETSYPFKFAVVSSGRTWSSANYLTNMAKDNGICVLGEQSKGGAYTPQQTPEAEGLFFDMSGRYKLLDKKGETVDLGIEPDYLLTEEKDGVIDYSRFFDFEEISGLIDRYYSK